jgi:5'(3')-deoxyribonucleotidase
MKSIAVDMDGVVADFVGLFLEQVKKQYGVVLNYSDISEFNIGNVFRKKFNIELDFYSLIYDGFFEDVPIYPNAYNSIKTLSKLYEIIFLTKSNGKYLSEKTNWLKKHFKDVDYELIAVQDFKSKRLISTDFIIDDAPEVLSVVTQPLIVISHPWNASFVPTEKTYIANSIADVPKILETYDV